MGPVRRLSGTAPYCWGDAGYPAAAEPALDLRITRNCQIVLVALRLIASQLLRTLLTVGRLQRSGGERGGRQNGRGPGWLPVIAFFG